MNTLQHIRNKPLSQYDLMGLVDQFKILKFKGIYMRDGLPTKGRQVSECGIMNLDLESGNGTHWTCWFKKDHDTCYYFDSFGLTPPDEFYRYMKVTDIYHNTYEIQQRNDVICGHLCVLVLYLLGRGVDTFHEILYFLYKNKHERKYFWSK